MIALVVIDRVTDCATLDSSDRNDVASKRLLELDVDHAEAFLDPHDLGLGINFTFLSHSVHFISD